MGLRPQEVTDKELDHLLRLRMDKAKTKLRTKYEAFQSTPKNTRLTELKRAAVEVYKLSQKLSN